MQLETSKDVEDKLSKNAEHPVRVLELGAKIQYENERILESVCTYIANTLFSFFYMACVLAQSGVESFH